MDRYRKELNTQDILEDMQEKATSRFIHDEMYFSLYQDLSPNPTNIDFGSYIICRDDSPALFRTKRFFTISECIEHCLKYDKELDYKNRMKPMVRPEDKVKKRRAKHVEETKEN